MIYVSGMDNKNQEAYDCNAQKHFIPVDCV